eukprot:187852_1
MASLNTCFLVELNSYLTTHHKQNQLHDLNSWLNDNEYDSDALIDDVYKTNELNSNIAVSLMNRNAHANHLFSHIQQYVEQNAKQVVIIGISGATRSGKSTLAHYLRTLFGTDNCITIHQDTYFDMPKIWRQLNGNWDHPEAINHDAFYETVSTQIKHYKDSQSFSNRYFYIILEGFMLYHDTRIVNCIHYFLWLEISRKVCFNRRMSTKRETHRYFNDNIWPNYQQYKANVFQNNFKGKVLVMDGTQPMDQCIRVSLKTIGREDIMHKCTQQ